MSGVRKNEGWQAEGAKRNWQSAVMGCLLAALVAAGIFLGFFRWGGPPPENGGTGPANGDAQDALSVTSGARDIGGSGGQVGSGGKRDQNEPAKIAGQEQKELAAQQAAQQAELDERTRELEAQAAAQAARENQLEQDRLRVQAEKQKAEAAAAAAEQQQAAAAAEAERLKQQAAENQPRPTAYNGPSSGSIVWQGEVKGTTLVTIDGNSSDTGRVVSGGLPGVLVMIQPNDAKHVGVAGAPGPSNAFRRLTLRIQGHGMLQETIRWSIP
jgi:hypothetical protein